MTVLEDLKSMTRGELVDKWANLFQTDAPAGISQAMMRRFLAIEIQSRRHGGLSKTNLAALRVPTDRSVKSASPRLRPGARLLREWNGVTHTVEVTDDGFDWNGETWRSLSVIVREITGAHWSGPRFFGLNKGSSA